MELVRHANELGIQLNDCRHVARKLEAATDPYPLLDDVVLALNSGEDLLTKGTPPDDENPNEENETFVEKALQIKLGSPRRTWRSIFEEILGKDDLKKGEVSRLSQRVRRYAKKEGIEIPHRKSGRPRKDHN